MYCFLEGFLFVCFFFCLNNLSCMTHNSLCEYITFVHGSSGVESIHNMICRTETILASSSSKFGVGRDLGEDPLMRGNDQTSDCSNQRCLRDVGRTDNSHSMAFQLPPHVILLLGLVC